MLEFLTRTFGRASHSSRHYTVPSAMTPIFWVSVVLTPTMIGGAFLFKTDPFAYYGFVGLALFLPFTAAAAYIYFAIRDPDRLQSEHHRAQTRAFEITEAKGMRFPIDPASLANIANPFPSHKQIEHKKDEPSQADGDEPSQADEGETEEDSSNV